MRKMIAALLLMIPCASFGGSWDTQYTWSYGALADTMKAMVADCHPANTDEFIEMGNWFRDRALSFL